MKRLKKSKNKVLEGVCGGLAEYFEVDPTLVRIGFCLFGVFGGFPAIITYLILWAAMPKAEA